MSDTLLPREAGRFIASRSKDVTLSKEAIITTAQKIFEVIQTNPANADAKGWAVYDFYPRTKDQAAIDWVFMVTTLNFSFWMEDDDNFTVTYKGKDWTGSYSLCAAVNRALDEGMPVTDPKFYASITGEQLSHILRSDSDQERMPMIEERLQCLHQTGRTLVEKYEGSFVNVVKAAEKSAQKLVGLLVQEFPSYNDESTLDGQQVAIHKRAQLAIGQIWTMFGGKGLGEFYDIDTLTMFADYRVPQILAWFGVLEYSPTLRKLLDDRHLFKSGDRLEVELRGCSIWAVELLVEALEKIVSKDQKLSKDVRLNASAIDQFLWDYRWRHVLEIEAIPFHRIRCVYY